MDPDPKWVHNTDENRGVVLVFGYWKANSLSDHITANTAISIMGVDTS